MAIWNLNRKSSRKKKKKEYRENRDYHGGSSRDIFRTDRHNFPDRNICKYPEKLMTRVKKNISQGSRERKPGNYKER